MPRFELRGKIGVDGNQWQAGLNKAQRAADKWSSETAGMIKRRLAGAFAVGAMLKGAGAIMDKSVEIRDKSQEIGVDTDTFQHLEYAAKQSSASIDDVSTAMKTLARMQQDATEGSEDALQAFERMGLVFDDIAGRSVQDVFMDVSRAVEEGKNSANLLADMQTLLGRGGQSLIPVFRSNFSGMLKESQQMGAPLDPEAIKELSDLADDITRAEQGAASGAGKLWNKTKNAYRTISAQNDILGNYLGNIWGKRSASLDPDYIDSSSIGMKLERQLEQLKEIKRNTESLK